MTKSCTIAGCDGKHEARGLCKRHYRRWQRQHQPDVERGHDQARRTTDHYRAYERERYRQRKHKKAANNALYRALLKGDIARESCSICGDEDTQAHHPDYDKPLEVTWLCVRHHTDLHAAA